MKEKKLYECEHCRTSYAEKDKAKQCEANHKKIKEIVDARYLSYKSDVSGIPSKICVSFNDGKEFWYHR